MTQRSRLTMHWVVLLVGLAIAVTKALLWAGRRLQRVVGLRLMRLSIEPAADAVLPVAPTRMFIGQFVLMLFGPRRCPQTAHRSTGTRRRMKFRYWVERDCFEVLVSQPVTTAQVWLVLLWLLGLL
jgi:hypothetical protein